MKLVSWQWIKTVPRLLAAPRPDPVWQAQRIISMQRRILLPVRTVVIAVVLYYVFSVDWSGGPSGTQTVILQTMRGFLLLYVAFNVISALIFFSWRWFPTGLFQWLVFVLGILDGLFVASLMLITGGWQSIAFWLFPVLIVLNAMSIPLAVPQIVLNLLLSGFFVAVGIIYANMGQVDVPGLSHGHPSYRAHTNTLAVAGATHPRPSGPPPVRWDPGGEPVEEEPPAQSAVLSLFVLMLLTLCCYGVQTLAERQRRLVEEAREFAVRQAQLESAGRLAAEFVHQIKNPLAVIANAAFSLRRSVRENKNSAGQQIEIIQEEVARADRVITQIMGYAQLSEGRVERLDFIEEMEHAIAQVFPPAVPCKVAVERRYADYFPPLLMQRGHLSEIFINLLKNAREAVAGPGTVVITAHCLRDNSIEISIRDTGDGIPPDKVRRIFEAYYTTKSGGSGMGLAIVRHNTELYGGTVQVKSEVGRGAEFILTFPANAIVSFRK
ncbi:MAG: sensor histidine kinase [Limisphaerales bacterium]